MRHRGVSLWENGSSAFHRTSHDCSWVNYPNRPGKRAIILWQSICHEKLQVNFQWSSLCEIELAYVRSPDDSQRLSLLPSHTVSVQNSLVLTSSPWFQREHLASKLYQIGRSFLKDSSPSDDFKPVDAVQWLQRAFSIADQPEDKTASGMAELKVGGSQLTSPLMPISSIVTP